MESSPPLRLRLRQLAAKLALSLSMIVATVVGLELATRLFTDIRAPLFRNDPVLGKTYRPGFADTVFVDESGRDIYLRFNREGLRGPDLSHAKAPSTRRVAIVGDSFTAAVAVSEERTATAELQAMLAQADPATNWQVMNCGVSGSSTAQEMVLYDQVINKYTPDVVVCAFCMWNDFGDNCRTLTSNANRLYFDVDDRGRLHQLPFSATRSNASTWLNRHSRFYVWQKNATRIVKSKAKKNAGQVHSGKHIYDSQPDERLQHAWKVTEALIAEFQRKVEADGGRFVLALLPAAEQVYEDNWQEILGRAGERAERFDVRYPDERLRQYGESLGIPVLVMTDAFRAAAPHASREYEDEWLYFDGRGHFNEAGNRLFAEQLYEHLAAEEPLVARANDRAPLR